MSTPRGEDETTPLLGASTFSEVDVYNLVHEIRVDIVSHIDTPLTYEQLIAPDSTYTIIRPLTEKYLVRRNPSVIFCLLLNKVQFTTDSHQLSIATLSESRATLCEILATRVLRGWSERSLHLATVLLTPWPIFQGASAQVVASAKADGEQDVLDDTGTALEMAIISSARRFIRSPSCQKVIEGIWSGKIIYSAVSVHALISDNYKTRPIQIYNPHKAPVLDHYRLKVPKIRAFLEYVNFAILFILYVVAIERLDPQHVNGYELVFIVYALAFSLDKAAAIREHGLKVFSSSLVNGFDLGFVVIFMVYLGARVYGVRAHDPSAMEFGADLLAIGAVIMFPRLAFMTLANNLMILSIRSMLSEFFFLMSVGIFCFIGFVYALRTLGKVDFHPWLGPILMVLYGFLSNTLLLTVLVAILGNTFATINADASAESMFRKAVATVEGVKADAVFSYQLPFNILAVVVLYPLSFVLNPRWFHKVNVFMIRVTNLPVLMLIALYERQTYNQSTLWEQICDYADRYFSIISSATGFEGLIGAGMDISAVFEIEREYGTAYIDWEGDDDQVVVIDGEEITTDGPVTPVTPITGTLTGSGAITESPVQTSFSTQVSPHTARRRRQSMNGAHGHGHGHGHLGHHHAPSPHLPPAALPPAPLPRVRRNSTLYGPSPLAQLFVRSPEEATSGPQRRVTVMAGSLPATSMVLQSPRRPQRVSLGPQGAAQAPRAAQMSTSLNVSSALASLEHDDVDSPKRPPLRAGATATIHEVSQPPSPSADEKQRRSVPFPSAEETTAAARQRVVSFKEQTSPRIPRTASLTRVASTEGTARSSTPRTPRSQSPRNVPNSPNLAARKAAPSPANRVCAKASELLESQQADAEAARDNDDRIASMELRQRRIEAMLEQLVASLGGQGDSAIDQRGVAIGSRNEEHFDTFDESAVE
ncbi:Calcium channel YVC1 [Vanrija pseudolonga]|uniref:Calcium channel YVC1 n=1 Tax=Vanrija pseudolonga TaxID=143232 RepID=A0AAF1BNY3_9TREE|nr:Calcium channel YVC1 [Vanrija pseudolonga]